MLGVPLPADQAIANALGTLVREARDTTKKQQSMVRTWRQYGKNVTTQVRASAIYYHRPRRR
jgi:hypothetical protein